MSGRFRSVAAARRQGPSVSIGLGRTRLLSREGCGLRFRSEIGSGPTFRYSCPLRSEPVRPGSGKRPESFRKICDRSVFGLRRVRGMFSDGENLSGCTWTCVFGKRTILVPPERIASVSDICRPSSDMPFPGPWNDEPPGEGRILVVAILASGRIRERLSVRKNISGRTRSKAPCLAEISSSFPVVRISVPSPVCKRPKRCGRRRMRP